MLEEIPADDNESVKSEKVEKKRFNSVQPVRETKKIGPLKIEKPYKGLNQSSFLSMSRKKIDDYNN